MIIYLKYIQFKFIFKNILLFRNRPKNIFLPHMFHKIYKE
jgi:hypothetical protein